MKWILLANIFSFLAYGQQISFSGNPYTQNFDSLATNTLPTATASWQQGITLPGWYANTSASGAVPSEYQVDLGQNTTTGAIFSYGSNNNDTRSDRALGSRNGSAFIFYGIKLVNDSGDDLSLLDISYDVELWRRAANNPQISDTLQFSYQLTESLAHLNDKPTGWILLHSTIFSPTSTSGAYGVDGPLAVETVTMTSGIDWRAGQTLWLRWQDVNPTGTDHGLAIDNLTIRPTAGVIPEPRLTGLIGAGLLILGIARKGYFRI